MERVLGLKPLSEENQKTFDKIWKWFIDRRLTDKEEPQVVSACGSYHDEGVIGIHEAHRKESFPLGAVILEEVLHYVLTSNDPKTSADFSTAFLQGILSIIAGQLADSPRETKREFQSMLIRHLWDMIKKSPC